MATGVFASTSTTARETASRDLAYVDLGLPVRSVQQDGGESADLDEADSVVGGLRDRVEVVDVQAGNTSGADDHRGQSRLPRAPQAPPTPLWMHPDPLDLADRRRLRSNLGLEDHLAVLESGPRSSGRDQTGDPPPVTAAAVTEPWVHTHLTDEHVDGRHQIDVEFVGLDLAHTRVDRTGRHRGQRHQRLTLTHIARRSPGRLEPLPHWHHQLGPADE